MTVHNRKLKTIQFSIGGTSFECQISKFNLDPGIGDGERKWTFCGESFVDYGDPEPTLALTFFSDWRSDGISDFLWKNQGSDADFVLENHDDIPEEHVRWTGKVRLKPGPVGGDARATETTELTLAILGVPEYERVNA